MGFTLDQLLDETGVSDLAGSNLVKKAAQQAKPNFAKLAERCRRAAEATPAEEDESVKRALVEKTAAVAIIGHTLAEIRAITEGGEALAKTAAAPASDKAEAFIKQALAAGHKPEDIAEFLEKNAFFGRIRRGLRETKAGWDMNRATKAVARGDEKFQKAFRGWQDVVRKSENLSQAERAALISKLRKRFGDENAHQILDSTKSKAFMDMHEFKELKRTLPPKPGEVPAAKKKAIGMNIGGTEVGLSKEQLNKMKTPALAVGAGYLGHRALTKNDEGKSKRGGVVIVN